MYWISIVTLMSFALRTTCITTGKCEPSMSVEMPNAQMMANGNVWDPDERVQYPSHAYWTEDGRIYGCPCMLGRPCLRKCCPKDEAMDFKSLQCIPYSSPVPWFRPNFTIDMEGNTITANPADFGVVYGNFCFGYLLEPSEYPEDKFYIDYDNATLHMVKVANGYGKRWKDFCLEYFPSVDIYLPYVCFSWSKESGDNYGCEGLRYILYPIGMAVSVVFLILSILVYCILPKLRNICGKYLIRYMISLLSTYMSLFTVQALGSKLSDNLCIAFGFIIYFSLLCTFFWLNVLCIDITLTFRPVSIAGNRADRERKKILLYSLYAWGMPTVMTVIALITEFHPDVPHVIYRPRFKLSCWFYDHMSKLLYFVFPVGILVFCNLILFFITARKIYVLKKSKEECERRGEKQPSKKQDKNRFRLYVKLCIVMGVSWILEILSYLIGGHKCIWIFTDMINTLQGLFIFLILICNRKVIGQLRIRLCPKLAAAEDPKTRLEESRSSEEEGGMPTSSASVDVQEGSGGNRRKDDFKLKRKSPDDPKSPGEGEQCPEAAGCK